jgi:hypothetical protein
MTETEATPRPSMWTLRAEVWNLLRQAKCQEYRDAINDVLALPTWEQCAVLALEAEAALREKKGE